MNLKIGIALLFFFSCAAARASDLSSDHEKLFFEHAIQERPGDSVRRDKLGDYHLAREDYQSAEKVFGTAVSLNPQDAYAWLQLGLVHRRLERPDLALSEFKTAAQWALYPIALRMAECERALSHPKQAIRILNALGKIVDTPDLHYLSALCRADLQSYRSAEKELDLAQARDARFLAGKRYFKDVLEVETLRSAWQGTRQRRFFAAALLLQAGIVVLGLWAGRKFLFFKAVTLETEEEF